jgi:hypothetical protein
MGRSLEAGTSVPVAGRDIPFATVLNFLGHVLITTVPSFLSRSRSGADAAGSLEARQGRTSRIMLNGVSVARRKRVNPASVAT